MQCNLYFVNDLFTGSHFLNFKEKIMFNFSHTTTEYREEMKIMCFSITIVTVVIFCILNNRINENVTNRIPN